MRRIFVAGPQLQRPTVVLEGDLHRHLVKVLRLGAGDEVVVFDGEGTEVDARIVAATSRTVELALGARRQVAPPRVRLTLLQAVPRADRMDLIVQKTTELGITRIVPVVAGRSVVRPPAGRSERWQTIAREAARQCGRADIPRVEEPAGLPQALSAVTETTRFVLWEETGQPPLRHALEGNETAVCLLVGPEGGFAPEEVAQATAAGFRTAGLGPRILRTETAAIVAVALVQAAVGGLD